MPGEFRFSVKMLANIKFWRKMVKPTLRLSKDALETPLPEGTVRDIRDFLTRSGPWKGHPIDSVEAFMAIPAPGVSIQNPVPAVIGIDEPVFTSLGFGMEGIKDGVVKYTRGICETHNSGAQCETYMCMTQVAKSRVTRRQNTEAPDIGTCFDSHCKSNMCGINSCSSQLCSTQRCIFHDCSTHQCSEQTSLGFTSELETHWDHPFVQELGRYFGVNMSDKLASAVMHYVGRNMFDESAK
jgi:hypothetical protein